MRKISIFAGIWQNNSYLCKRKKKKQHFKTTNCEKSRILPIFNEMVTCLWKKKKIMHLKQIYWLNKFIIQLTSNFADLWRKNYVLKQNYQSFKKYQPQKKKVYNSIISHENRKFCPIFIEIIAFVQRKREKKI